MPEKTLEEKAYDYALFLLGLKLRTEGELREKFRTKKYPAEVADKIISQLKSNRYIDDSRYAEVYAENLKKYKTFGYFGIKKKLMEKRLPTAVIENILAESLSEAEETKIAQRFLKKNGQRESLTKWSKIPFDQAKQKLAQKLKSRGFRGSVIAKLLF